MTYGTSVLSCDPKLEVRKFDKIHCKFVMVIIKEL